jgi:hypothetical protein
MIVDLAVMDSVPRQKHLVHVHQIVDHVEMDSVLLPGKMPETV